MRVKRFATLSAKWLGVPLALLALSVLSVLTAEDGATPPIDRLMAQMFNDLEALNHGLFHSDYQEAAAAAEGISNHPMVQPAQRAVIARTLGKEMAEFKAYDTAVHDAAVALSASARSGDYALVPRRYSESVGGCMGCHARFRDRVRAALESR